MEMTVEEIKWRYREGASMQILADLNGVSVVKIKEVLTGKKLSKIETENATKEMLEEYAASLLRDGFTLEDVSETFGKSMHWVQKIKKRHLGNTYASRNKVYVLLENGEVIAEGTTREIADQVGKTVSWVFSKKQSKGKHRLEAKECPLVEVEE